MITAKSILLAGSLAISSSVVIAACGGGGGNSQTPGTAANTGTVPVATPAGTPPPHTAAVTVTVRKPQRGSATVTARRTPKYVSPGTYQLQVTATGPADSASGTGSCYQSTCTATVFAPLDTTSLTVEALDYAGNVLAVGTLSGITITPGVANNFPTGSNQFYLNGVVETLSAATTISTSAIVNTVGSSFSVNALGLDYDGFQIVAPGNLVNPSGNEVVDGTGSPNTVSLSVQPACAASHISLAAPTWITPNYATQYTLSYDGTDLTGCLSGGGQVTLQPSSTVTGGIPYSPAFIVPIFAQSIAAIADVNNPPSGYQVEPAPLPTPTAAAASTSTTVELPASPASGAVPVNLVIVSDFPNTTSLTLNDPNSCDSNLTGGSLSSALSGASLSAGTYSFALAFNVDSGYGTCTFGIVDGNGLTANITLAINTPQLIIQGRKKP